MKTKSRRAQSERTNEQQFYRMMLKKKARGTTEMYFGKQITRHFLTASKKRKKKRKRALALYENYEAIN